MSSPVQSVVFRQQAKPQPPAKPQAPGVGPGVAQTEKEKMKEKEKAGAPLAGEDGAKEELNLEQLLAADSQRRLLVDETIPMEEKQTPMLILASCAADGLGLTEWWR